MFQKRVIAGRRLKELAKNHPEDFSREGFFCDLMLDGIQCDKYYRYERTLVRHMTTTHKVGKLEANRKVEQMVGQVPARFQRKLKCPEKGCRLHFILVDSCRKHLMLDHNMTEEECNKVLDMVSKGEKIS